MTLSREKMRVYQRARRKKLKKDTRDKTEKHLDEIEASLIKCWQLVLRILEKQDEGGKG